MVKSHIGLLQSRRTAKGGLPPFFARVEKGSDLFFERQLARATDCYALAGGARTVQTDAQTGPPMLNVAA